MKRRLLSLLLILALASCSVPKGSHIVDVADLPLKSASVPGMNWEQSPLRANARYLMYRANTKEQKKACIGDYYYVRWRDDEPHKPVRLVMKYTQSLTASAVQMRMVTYDEPRSACGTRKAEFFFTGEERARRGDILSWRLELYVDGVLKDTRQSYLWE